MYNCVYIYVPVQAYLCIPTQRKGTLTCSHIEIRAMSISPPLCSSLVCFLSMQDIDASS